MTFYSASLSMRLQSSHLYTASLERRPIPLIVATQVKGRAHISHGRLAFGLTSRALPGCCWFCI